MTWPSSEHGKESATLDIPPWDYNLDFEVKTPGHAWWLYKFYRDRYGTRFTMMPLTSTTRSMAVVTVEVRNAAYSRICFGDKDSDVHGSNIVKDSIIWTCGSEFFRYTDAYAFRDRVASIMAKEARCPSIRKEAAPYLLRNRDINKMASGCSGRRRVWR